MPFGTRSERRRRYTFIGIEPYAIGAAISAIVGYASIYLIGLVIKGKFYIFAFYCFAIGIATFFLL
jgi:undecaprenyl pyrophosphate phosphatase UppP